MRAEEILNALRKAYPQAAIVPELRIDDPLAYRLRQGPYYRRCDALMFDGPQRTIFEIKVTKEDAARETDDKQSVWKPYVHRICYVTPAGMIDTPPNDGAWKGYGLLWVHSDGTLEWKRRCKINRYPEPLPQKVLFNIAWRAANGRARSYQ